MTATHTDIGEGKRIDAQVKLVDSETVTCEDELVHKLQVVDLDGQKFSVLVPGTLPVELKRGFEYRLSAAPGFERITPRGVKMCPSCGAPLQPAAVADDRVAAVATAIRTLAPDEPFCVVDERADIWRVDAPPERVDDWTPMSETEPPAYVCERCGQRYDDAPGERTHNAVANMSMAAPESSGLGMATGGAKDADNFRENIAAGYTPQAEAISDEGLFYDYEFDTGEGAPPETDALFAPRYATAVSDHPVDGQTEQFLSVGLDSTLSAEQFERPRLDLVVVLDVSGSMDSQFDEYYYDEEDRHPEQGSGTETKLEAAVQSLCALTEQLADDDQLGVVLFNNRAHVAKPLRLVERTDMDAIRRHIREVQAGGGTNMADGFEAALDMLLGPRARPVERRAVFMTDMMPNTGTTDRENIVDLFADAAAEGVHTTFVGMGLDANADLAESLSGIRGANHYFITSGAEFERRLGAEFDYMVTPLVYDLTLELEGEGSSVEAVHGSPTADADSDRLLHVGTLFPSPQTEEGTRGGVVLARLGQTSGTDSLELVASWTERGGEEHTERVEVSLPAGDEHADHDGVRKAVALSRYARELRRWARDTHARAGTDDWPLPDPRGEHERESVPLVVQERHVERFEPMRASLADERAALGDETLEQELALLDRLCEQAATGPRDGRQRTGEKQ